MQERVKLCRSFNIVNDDYFRKIQEMPSMKLINCAFSQNCNENYEVAFTKSSTIAAAT